MSRNRLATLLAEAEKPVFVAVIFFFLAAGDLRAQLSNPPRLDPNKAITQYLHDVWQTDDGLPQNSVNNILQTRDGYLWFGTEKGLVRFDGVKFTVFDKNNTKAFQNNAVYRLVEDREGALWIGTAGGLIRFKEDQFTAYNITEGVENKIIRAIYHDKEGNLWIGIDDEGGSIKCLKDGKLANKKYSTGSGISSICGDNQGNLWIGTFGGGLFQLQNGKLTNYTTQEGLANSFVRAVCEDQEGSSWIGTDNGLNRFHQGKLFTYTTQDGLSNNIVTVIYKDSQGSLWIGTRAGGLNRWREGKFTTFTSKEGLSDDIIRSIYEDREGNLWIGTGKGGLNRLREGKFITYTVKEGLSQDFVNAIYQDREGSFWISTYGGGLNRFKDGQFTTFTTMEGLADNVTRAIFEDRQGNLWIGTDKGLNRLRNGTFTTYTTKEGLSNNVVRSIHDDHEGNLWIGTDNGINCLKNGKLAAQTITNATVWLIEKDKTGALWFAAVSRGLYRLKDGTVTQYTTKDGLAHNIVTALYEDGEGSLWIGTYGGGLNRFKDGKFTTITMANGLFDDLICQIFEDEKGLLWMSCNKGIFCVSKKELTDFAEGKIDSIHCVSYDKADGMRSRECNVGTQPAGCKAKDGKFWFPTGKGVVVVDPENIKRNEQPPPVIIEPLIVDHEAMKRDGKLEIPPGKDKFEFHYTGLSFLAPEKVLFKYKLEGFDKGWVEAGGRRTAYYTNLSPGHYTFRVKACNNDGLWNETGATLAFYLKPHFYQTTYFYVLCAISLIFTGFGAYRFRVRQMKAREKQLVKLVEERTKSLQEEKAKTERALIATEEARAEAERQKEIAEQAKAVIEEHEKKLIEMDQIKSRFFANISHEFRTPLTLTIGPLENALAGAYGHVNGELRQQCEVMLRNSRRLLRLINQLLDISRLESGKMQLMAKRGNLVKFVTEVTSLFTSLADQKHITLQIHAEQQELELYFDADKLEKVLYNLLSNAFKFTPAQGKIWVTVAEASFHSNHGGREFVEIKVKDTGRGIANEEIPCLFDRFHQTRHSSVREQEGTGIGLSLAKDLVLLHGGTIRVQSELGFGSEFIVALPKGKDHLSGSEMIEDEPEDKPYDFALRARVEMSELAFNSSVEQDDDRKNGKPVEPIDASTTILIVEDNRDVREYVKGVLKGKYHWAEATDGDDGLAKAKELMPDLIISDVMMPRRDGYELCRALKADEKLNHIPVILLTAKASEDMKVEGLESGADDYMPKPFNAKELLARTNNLIKMRRQEKELKRFNEALEQKVREQLETIIKSKRLAKFFPPKLVDRILAGEGELELTSERKNLTMFFSDLTGFTDLSDRTEPERITRILNEYFTEMVGLIEKHHGTLGKFIGDGIMVFWGAPEEMETKAQARNAVAMALAMQKKMKALGQKWLAEGLDHNVRIRIGIHQDYVTVGNFGSAHLMEYTVIGKGVNLAKRLESACNPGKILASFSVYSLTKEEFPYEELHEREFKGFARALRVCELAPDDADFPGLRKAK